MTDMPFEDFQQPSTISGGGGSAHPTFAQLIGRLVWIYPTTREDNVTTPKRVRPHTKVTCDLAFLSGGPIDAVINGETGAATPLTPPVQPGQVMVGRWVNQDWFANRLKDKVGVPGFPGIVGIVGQGRGKTGNMFYQLTDPSPEQMAQVRQWFTWKNSQPAGSVNYVPAPVAPPVAPPVQYAQPVQATPVPQGSPFAPAARAPAPAGPWQPTMPPGMTPATPAATVPAAPQPGPEVPPWQR
jgi:hypothetical protein